MPITTNAKEAFYIQSLLKEALYLTDELSSMDKKIEKDITNNKNELTMWIETHPLAKWCIEWKSDDEAQKVLKAIFDKLFELLKISTSITGIMADATVQIFSSSRETPRKMAYFDVNPKITTDYYAKTDRLQEIYRELFYLRPPSAINLLQSDRCAKEACWRQN